MSSRRLTCLATLLLVACGGARAGDPENWGEAEEPLIAADFTSMWQASVKTSLTASEGNLSAGASHWAHFTASTITSNPSSGIKNLQKWGNSATIPTGPLAFSWTTSTGSTKTDVRSHLRTCGSSAAIAFDVPASLKGRKLRLFIGAHNAKASVTGRFLGMGYVNSAIQNPNGSQFGYIDMDYSAAQDNGVLKVSLAIEQAGNTPITANSCISLLAAKVSDLPKENGTASVSVYNGTTDLFEGWNYPVTVTASHPDGVRGVELFYNGVKVGEDTTAPYDFGITTKAGPGTLYAEVTGNRGTVYKGPQLSVVGWYRYGRFGTEQIPDAGDWVEGALSRETPVAGKTVKAVVAFTSIQHDYVGDLQIKLVSPNDKEVMLAQNVGGGGVDYYNTYFDDRASTSITSASAPFWGWFKPQNPLALLAGEPSSGAKPWRLSVRDTYWSDTGSVSFRDIYLKLD